MRGFVGRKIAAIAAKEGTFSGSGIKAELVCSFCQTKYVFNEDELRALLEEAQAGGNDSDEISADLAEAINDCGNE